ncbi:MAG: hypothetical protein R3E50_04550 [Halioglobus sp.]
MNYISVADAINAPGLRLVLTAGVPGPWGEAAKAMLAYKQLAYTPVLQEGGGENAALREWTGPDVGLGRRTKTCRRPATGWTC